MDLLTAVFLSTGAYLAGSIPTAYIVVRWIKGLDIRLVGSKNVGTLNTYHQVGILGAMLVLAVDASKGTLAVLVPAWVGAPGWAFYVTAVLAAVGHNWPVFLKFRGGKGAATALGISLAIAPQLTLIALGPTILLAALTRNMIIAVGSGFLIVNALAVVTGQRVGIVMLFIVLSLLVVGTYLVCTWDRVCTAIRTRQFRGIFYGTNFNP